MNSRYNKLHNSNLWMHFKDCQFCKILLGAEYQIEIPYPDEYFRKKLVCFGKNLMLNEVSYFNISDLLNGKKVCLIPPTVTDQLKRWLLL